MKYTILSPVDHNGKRLQPGESADFSKNEAGDLLAVGAIGHHDAKAAKAAADAASHEQPNGEPLDPNAPPVQPQV